MSKKVKKTSKKRQKKGQIWPIWGPPENIKKSRKNTKIGEWCTPEKTRPVESLSIWGIRTKNPLKKWSIGSGGHGGGPGGGPVGGPGTPKFG